MKKIVFSLITTSMLTVLMLVMCCTLNTDSARVLPTKIIGLVPVRNEALVIEQCLRALALYVDEIIVLNDASEDDTLSIIQRVGPSCKVARLLNKDVWNRHESFDRNALLNEGRKRGGTHFIVIDADEMFTANCLDKNLLRNEIMALQPGDSLLMHWIRLWRDIDHFKASNAEVKTIIFCDDGVAKYPESIIHTPRVPPSLKGIKKDFGRYTTHGLLHFQSVNWRNMRIRQAWYQCFERVHFAFINAKEIASSYHRITDETSIIIQSCPPYWFAYDFFDRQAFEAPDTWREQQIAAWIQQYGFDYFKELPIWDIDWHFMASYGNLLTNYTA